MSNDLIFPILPRNTKVPVVEDGKVKKVARTKKTESLNQDEKEQHETMRQIEVAEQMSKHQNEKRSKDNDEHDQDGLTHIDIDV